MTKLTKLFEPGTIGNMKVKNRLVMAPMGTHSVDMDGFMNDRTIDYYIERAKGGVGLIIVQGAAVSARCRLPHMLSLYDDKFIPQLKKLADAIHQYDTKVVCQIAHHGLAIFNFWREYERPADIEVTGPSALPCVAFNVIPRELTPADIHHVAELHAEAALRAITAGYDAVEVHGAHGYFLSAFLSPLRNRRKDEYGGSVENRARFACEILAATRKAIGPDFPLIFRMNGSDFLPGGITVEDSVAMAPMFAKAGASALHISAGAQESSRWRDLTYLFPDAAIVHTAAAIKKAVKIPVITVGKIGDPVLADKILKEGKADFVAMGRGLLADPDLPNKAREGRFDDINRCIYCNNCRVGFNTRAGVEKRGSSLSCTVNPALLREREFELKPATKAKKVMVVGGGLAGMEATRVLAERGHNVTLYERSDKLGGQWNIASMELTKKHFATALDTINKGLKKTNAKIVFNKEVNKQFVEEQKPDAVVVATGALSTVLPIPGIDGKNVVQAVDIFAGKAKVGQKVVVIGGRLRGMEIADALADQGKKVSLVTKNRLGEDGAPLERNTYVELRDRLIRKGVCFYDFCPVWEIRPDGVYVVDGKELLFLEADTVVLAIGARAENKLSKELTGCVSELYSVGDCVEARNAKDAINEGAEVGRKI